MNNRESKFIEELKNGKCNTRYGTVIKIEENEYVVRTGIGEKEVTLYLPKDDTKRKLKVNQKIKFKLLNYDEENNKLYITTNLQLYYQMAFANKMELIGTITKVSEYNDKKIIIIDCLGDIVYMDINDYNYVGYNPNETKLIDKKVNFMVKEVKSNGEVHVSRSLLLVEQRDNLIEKLKDGAVIDARISLIQPWGARLTYYGVPLILRNKDFSLDYTKVEKVYNKGDIVNVKLTEVSPGKRIFVEPVEKFKNDTLFSFDEVEVGDILVGEVITVATIGIFVNIYPGVDVLCPIPDPFICSEPTVGDTVMLKVSKVIPEQQRVRGKIVKIVPVAAEDLADEE